MNIQQLESLFLRRQSCRAFDANRAVTREQIEKICRIATLAPSACNAQPWKLVVTMGEKKQQVAECLQGLGMNKFASDAAALIAVCEGESKLSAKVTSRFSENDFLANDLGIFTAHLVLAAEAEGLGSCILGWRREEKLAELFHLKKGKKVPVVVAVGYPAEGYEIREKNRKPFDDVFEFFD